MNQVSELLHSSDIPGSWQNSYQIHNRDVIRRITPSPADAIIAGAATRNSFWTPDKDVKVVAPVKFKARYAAIMGRTRKLDIPAQRGRCIQIDTNRTQIIPKSQPFQAKDLPGIQGKTS
jgi:hypothetical protein